MRASILRFRQTGHEWSLKYGSFIVPVALVVLALGLIYWRIVRGYSPPISYVPWPDPPHWVQTLYTFRWIVRALLITAGLALLCLEFLANSVSHLLQQAIAGYRSLVLLIALLSAIIGTFIFQPGNYLAADYRSTVSTSWAILEAIRQGQPLVYWTTYVHLGGPLMQFHNSLYYYFAAAVGVFVPDFFDAAEVSAYILFIASGFTIYAFTRQLTDSKLAGLVAVVAYCGSYYRFELLSLSANFPLDALLFTLWPLQFYFIERICSSARPLEPRAICLLALSVGAQLWNHSLYGAWAVGFGLLYITVRVFALEPSPSQSRGIRFLGLIGAHVIGLLIGIYQLLPVLLENTLIPEKPQALGVGLDQIFIRKIAAEWGGHYLSFAIIILAVLGAILILFLNVKQAYAIVLLAVAPLLLAIGPHYLPGLNDLLAAIPLGNLVYARGAERYLHLALGPLAVLNGFAARLILLWLHKYHQRLGWFAAIIRWPSERLPALIIAIILLENVPLTLFYSFKSPDTYLSDTPGRWPIIATLAQTTNKTTRVYDAAEGLTPSFFYPMFTGHPSLSGHYQEAPPSFQTSQQFEQLISSDLINDHISPQTAELLFQLNIGYLITNGADLTLPELERIQRTDSTTLWRVSNHSPIVATAHPTAANGVTVTLPKGGDVPVILTRHLETATTVVMDFTLPKRAFVQLAYSAYPYQQVLLDGQSTSVTPTSLGLIGFWAEAGDHSVEVLPELSPLRKITLTIGAIALVASIAVALFSKRRV